MSSQVAAVRSPTIADRRRVVVFSGRYAGDNAVEAADAMTRSFADWRFLFVQEFPPRSRKRLLRAKLARLRDEPVGYPVAFLRARFEQLRRPERKGVSSDTQLAPDLGQLHRGNAEYLRCDRLHDKSTLERVRAWKPWLGVALAAPILRKALYTIPECGTINLHMSLLPEYRGMPPGFWELHDGAAATGVSVHWIDEQLDTGDIITQEEIAIPRYATVAGLQALLDEAGTRVLVETLRQLDSGRARIRSQGEARTPTRSRPAYRVQRSVERRCWRNRTPPMRIRSVVKQTVLFFFVYGWVPLRNAVRNLRGSARTSVLLYHRVSDEFLDNVTVGVEQFWRQLCLLQRHYEVVHPTEWLLTSDRPTHRPRVVITFDDGYQDNVVAAMLLRRAGLPCVFFISTRIVGTERGFPHDLELLGRPVRALGWNEVSQLAAQGFLIGNHTADHANLGQVPLEEAMQQVLTARLELEDRLGEAPAAGWLAYPYGRERDISEDLRRRLPELGVDHCFSAYGGSNAPRFDRWNILRQGVDQSMSLLRLRAAIEGWRV